MDVIFWNKDIELNNIMEIDSEPNVAKISSRDHVQEIEGIYPDHNNIY